jgi:hypothetical protein
MANILERWEISVDELTQIVDENPSLRGFMIGYVSEFKVKQMFFTDPRLTETRKYDDHDRTKKGDLSFFYKGVEIRVESKSLQSTMVKHQNGIWKGTFQCDASDRRKVTLPNGNTVETTCLLVGEFDLVAVNLFAFGDQWRFAFAKNGDLPRTTYKKYKEEDRQYLLSSSMKITWPLQPPFVEDPFILLDEIVKEKLGR